MNEQHREVQAWLESIYGGDPVPAYEVSQHTLDVLTQLKACHDTRERHAQLLLQDAEQKTEEYLLEAGRLSAVLQHLGLTLDSLSQSGLASLRTLVSVASLLHTRDVTDTSLLLALSALSEQKLKLAESRHSEQRLVSNLFNKTKAALQKSNTLHKVLADLEEQASLQGPELTRKVKEAGFLNTKARQYKKQAQQLQVELSQTGVNSSIFHHKLVTRAEELAALQEKIKPLKAHLQSFHKLPPDLSLAKVKVEEAKRELASLEAELDKHMDLMHMM